MAFNELLSSSFLFSIAIIIILIGGVFAYVSYRMSEQDHKITSMLGLISTMAEELQFFRSNLIQPDLTNPNLESNDQPQTQTQTRIILDPNNLVAGQPILIPVSDDEDNGDDESDDEDNGDDDESDDDESDDDESEDLDEDNDDFEDVDEKLNEDLNEDLDEKCNIKSIHLEEPIDLNLDLELLLDPEPDELLVQDLQSISISDLEETDKKPDYRKWSLTKLKEVIVEKSIVTDASKLKKNDILKLLGVE